MFTEIRTFLALTLTALLLLTAGAARAQATHWHCWLHSDGAQAVCMVFVPGTLNPAAAVAPREVRNRALSPAEYLRVVRGRPAELVGQQVFVPLHTVPYDEASVAELMSAVLCGSQQGCQARYQHDMSRVFASTPELFVDLNDILWDGRPI